MWTSSDCVLNALWWASERERRVKGFESTIGGPRGDRGLHQPSEAMVDYRPGIRAKSQRAPKAQVARCTRRRLPPPKRAERSLAEGEGFEPPEPFRVQWFSRPPPSTTRPSLRVDNARNSVHSSDVVGDQSLCVTRSVTDINAARIRAPAIVTGRVVGLGGVDLAGRRTADRPAVQHAGPGRVGRGRGNETARLDVVTGRRVGG